MTPLPEILKQIDAVLSQYHGLRARSKCSDCSDLPDVDTTSAATVMLATIARLSPQKSEYAESAKALIAAYSVTNVYVLAHLAGILTALRAAYIAGYLATVTELIHATVFADFIEMAEHLLSEGYKDPAAVIAGSTLEEHLRGLCVKNGIPVDHAGKAKKADMLNAELSAAAYSKLDQKSVTAWLDLRNKAAHGKYGEYTSEQVVLMIQGVRDFMARNPA